MYKLNIINLIRKLKVVSKYCNETDDCYGLQAILDGIANSVLALMFVQRFGYFHRLPQAPIVEIVQCTLQNMASREGSRPTRDVSPVRFPGRGM